MTETKIPRVALQFGDGPNDTTGRGPDKGYYDNGVWENVLGIPYTPNVGQRNPRGFRTAAEFGGWLIENKIDVLIWTLWVRGVAVDEIKRIARDTKFIGLTDHPLNIDLLMSTPAGPGGTVPYVKNLGNLDAIMVLTPREYGFYGGLHTNVHHVGLPFPHEGYKHLIVPREPMTKRKAKVKIGLSVGGPGWAWWDRNYMTTAWAYRAIHQTLEKSGIECEGVWLSVSYDSKCPVMPLLQGTKGTTLQTRSDMQTYLTTLQSCDLVISNIMRDTPGRLVAECAYFGVPCVGSNSLALQGELFPTLSHDPFDIRSTVESAVALVSDGVPEDLIPNAQKGLQEYGFDRSREKFLGVLESLGYSREYQGS